MSTVVAVPEPLRFFIERPPTARAINDLLEKTTAPDDLQWQDFPDLIKARLTARTVQAHFALFLHDLWRVTWGTALTEAGIDLRQWQETWDDVGQEEVWNDRGFTAKGRIGRKPLHFSVWLSESDRPRVFNGQVGFYIKDGTYHWSNDLELPAPWDAEPDDDYRVTDDALICISSETATFDAAPLLLATRDALDVMRRCA
ncbi:hypothetical protein [Rhodospira trueperi]|uniref:Uncharacterized protein n=1 Tax=Rhodospira trueperi TaxID=69960 RepID=A0A1G7HKN5_9PROT|nr:hypothetical protein [Rhodospira trueperi]SDF00958.1 hypothetical protein SAMN05421720_12219 [Rhodospira trueperi]